MRLQQQFNIFNSWIFDDICFSLRAFLNGKKSMKTVQMVFEDCVAPSLATNKLNQTKCVRELITLPISGKVVFVVAFCKRNL